MAGGARVSPRRGRVRAVVVIVAERRAGVSPRAPGGGGEPRAARAHAARSRSLPAPPARSLARRRARSLFAPPQPARPRLRPVFLWARQRCDGLVHEVHCEDYDERNRLRVARTDRGWRVIPRSEIYDAISVPRRRRRHRQRHHRRRRRSAAAAWAAPDLESHIPSHTIAVPRAPPEPTPLDNLLAVAELELREQQGDLLDAVARDVMSFDLPDTKVSETAFYERKPTSERTTEDDLGAKDLFETISEAHYLPELHGPHDEELLESLVEKGCEDNQILGQALDKLAHLVHHSEYVEEEDILLSDAPVTDIIDRLEQSLESPGRSSMTAAQGLLHLHQLAEHHTPAASYSPADDDVFTAPPVTHSDCAMESLAVSEELPNTDDLTHMEYEETHDEKRLDLEPHISDNHILCAETVPETNESYEQLPPESISNLMGAELPPNKSELTQQNSPPSCDINAELPKQETDNNFETHDNVENELPTELKIEQEDDNPMTEIDHMELAKDLEDDNQVELVPTDLRINQVQKKPKRVVSHKSKNINGTDDNLSEKSDEQPRDLSFHRRLPTPHASPKRIDIPRAPSRESDAMQSPQPSGIPAVPSSPEIFSMPHTKSKQTLFLESLLSSPSPKMYTSEVTISKQQCEPLNLGKHRKSASPTITSCSDEIKKLTKEFGEPQEKKVRRESTEELAKISKVFSKCNENVKSKNPGTTINKMGDERTPLQQLHILKTSPDFNIPNPLLVPRDKLDLIIAAPGREIPALLIERPELRLPEAFEYPAIVGNPDLVVMTFSQLECILANEAKKRESDKSSEKTTGSKTATVTEKPSKTPPDQTGQPKAAPAMDALAGDIDAATSAALNQMFWIPYISQLEAMAACSQNMDFIKALNSSGYTGPNYNDLSQMFPSSRFMNPSAFPAVMTPADYDNRLQFAMWQEAMNNANASTSQRPKQSSVEAHMKENASKSTDVQNPYVHSTKNHQSKPHSSARTSPIAHNYNTNQRTMNHNAYLQGMYPGINPNIRPNMPLPGLQIPYYNPNMMGSQRSPRTQQQKSPTSPYYPNNNYLHSLKQSEAHGRQRTSSTSSQESPRPRISVKSLHNLLEPTAASGSSMRRTPNPPHAAMGRRRDEPEVGSTTPLGEPPPHLPPHPHPHDPASFHLWHPLFGNQKSYNTPWPWTTVTATGD